MPYDAETNTVYIPQSLRNEEWEGGLSAAAAGADLCIACSGEQADSGSQEVLPDKKKSIADNMTFRIALITEENYMEGNLVFTGLPVVMIAFEDGEIVEKETHGGKITVIDPDRRETVSEARTN